MRKMLRTALGVSAAVTLSYGVAFALAPEHDMDYNSAPIVHNLRSGQGSCSYCHTPHSAAQQTRLAANVDVFGSYATFGNAGLNLAAAFCGVCHYNKPTYQAIGAPNGSSTMLSTAAFNHPVGVLPATAPDTTRKVTWPYSSAAFAGMECTSCHDPHTNEEVAAGFSQFLRAGTHKAAVTPRNFCANCHPNRTADTTVAADRANHDHPVNIVADATRGGVAAKLILNGAFNKPEGDISGGHLVAEHTAANDGVNTDPATGLVSCQTCHMPHAAKQDSQLFPLFTVVGDGCSGCHSVSPNGNDAENHPVGPDTLMASDNKNDTTSLLVRINNYPNVNTGNGHATSTVFWPNNSGLALYTVVPGAPPAPDLLTATARASGGQVWCKTCHGGAHQTTTERPVADVNTDAYLLREARNAICVNCHGQNNAFYMNQTKAAPDAGKVGNHATVAVLPPSAPSDTAKLWYRLPTGLTYATVWIDGTAKGAVMNGDNLVCNTCHVAHGADGTGSLNNLTTTDGDTKRLGDRVLLLQNNFTVESGLCIKCHAPAGTHPVTVTAGDVALTNLVGTGGVGAGTTRPLQTARYPVKGAPANMVYDGAEMYCQSCHRPHEALSNFGSFVLRETGTDAYETANGVSDVTGSSEPTTWSRDPTCGTRTNTTGCHTL